MCGVGGQKGELKREGTGCLNSNAKHGTRPGRLLLSCNPGGGKGGTTGDGGG